MNKCFKHFKSVRFMFAVYNNPVYIYGDRTFFERLYQKLLDNGIKEKKLLKLDYDKRTEPKTVKVMNKILNRPGLILDVQMALKSEESLIEKICTLHNEFLDNRLSDVFDGTEKEFMDSFVDRLIWLNLPYKHFARIAKSQKRIEAFKRDPSYFFDFVYYELPVLLPELQFRTGDM